MPGITGPGPRVRSSNLWVRSSKTRVRSSIPRVCSSIPRVRSSQDVAPDATSRGFCCRFRDIPGLRVAVYAPTRAILLQIPRQPERRCRTRCTPGEGEAVAAACMGRACRASVTSPEMNARSHWCRKTCDRVSGRRRRAASAPLLLQASSEPALGRAGRAPVDTPCRAV